MHMAGNPIATRLIEVPLQNSANSLLVVLARQVPASPRFFSPSLPDFFLSAARFSEKKKTSQCRIVSFLAVRLSLRCIAERRKGGNYGVRMPIERFKMPRKLCQTRYPTTERIEDKSSEVHNFLKTLSRNVAVTYASHENGRGSHIVCLSCRNLGALSVPNAKCISRLSFSRFVCRFGVLYERFSCF